jgi:hypothetical protein
MNAGILIPILVPLGFFAMIFGIIYLNKKENLAMIEKGMNPKNTARNPEPYRNLKWGLLLVGAGVGLFLAYIFDQYLSRNDENEALYFALIAIGGGTGLIISYRMEMKELRASGSNWPRVPSEL